LFPERKGGWRGGMNNTSIHHHILCNLSFNLLFVTTHGEGERFSHFHTFPPPTLNPSQYTIQTQMKMMRKMK